MWLGDGEGDAIAEVGKGRVGWKTLCVLSQHAGMMASGLFVRGSSPSTHARLLRTLDGEAEGMTEGDEE